MLSCSKSKLRVSNLPAFVVDPLNWPPAAIAGNRGLREDGGDCGDEAGIFRGGGLRGEDMEERGHQWFLQRVSGSVDCDTFIQSIITLICIF